MACLGYIRISTGDQTLDLQKDALLAAGVSPAQTYEDTASGALTSRPGLAAVLKALREKDTLVIWRLDRLGRNTKHLIEIVEDLTARDIGLKTLTGFHIDTSTSHGRMIFTIFAALAEYERALTQERILAGLAAARARGRKGGRKPKLSPDQQQLAVQMARGGTPVTSIARHFGCARHTVYKALAQFQTVQGSWQS
jgi:DNA invertase Pin-like site-specific DNA recombinase